MPQFKRGSLFLKTLLSIWAVYHIFAMLVMPNLGSYFGRFSQPAISKYASAIGLNANWNFFSPDPAHTMYIRYTIYFGDSEEPIHGTFPREGKEGVVELTRKRELYVMRFMVIEPRRLQSLMGPWLCRQYSGAESVEMEHVIETVAPLEQAVTLRNESMSDLSRELEYVRAQYSCGGESSDEVEL